MKPGFLETEIATRSSNGRDDRLLDRLHFRDIDGTLYQIPAGSETDGGSTPRLAWLIPGFEPTGTHWFDWILHDSAYRQTLLVRRHIITWLPARLTRLEADQILIRSLRIRGMDPIRRALVWSALRAAGWRHFTPPPP
jgi:hypothetical protein